MTCRESIETLAEALKKDRTIKIYVGTSEIPYLVSQAALCNASDYFVKAIKNEERMGAGELGVLRFPEDDETAWKFLLFWIMREKLPAMGCDCVSCHGGAIVDEDFEDIMRVWILADKYLMPKLQNAAMMVMLRHLDQDQMRFWAGLQTLRDHTTNSVLGRLICESMVEITYGGGNHNFTPERLDNLDGIPGAIASLLAALNDFNKKSKSCTDGNREWPSRAGDSNIWEEFMVKESVEGAGSTVRL